MGRKNLNLFHFVVAAISIPFLCSCSESGLTAFYSNSFVVMALPQSGEGIEYTPSSDEAPLVPGDRGYLPPVTVDTDPPADSGNSSTPPAGSGNTSSPPPPPMTDDEGVTIPDSDFRIDCSKRSGSGYGNTEIVRVRGTMNLVADLTKMYVFLIAGNSSSVDFSVNGPDQVPPGVMPGYCVYENGNQPRFVATHNNVIVRQVHVIQRGNQAFAAFTGIGSSAIRFLFINQAGNSPSVAGKGIIATSIHRVSSEKSVFNWVP